MLLPVLQFVILCLIPLHCAQCQSATVNEVVTTTSPPSNEDDLAAIVNNSTAANNPQDFTGIVSPVAQWTSTPITSQPTLTPRTEVISTINAVPNEAASTQNPPTPIPTFNTPTGDIFSDILPISISASAVLSLTFPSNTTYNTTHVAEISSAIKTFLTNRGNFSSSIFVDVKLGDSYGVIPEPIEGEISLVTTVTITVPWVEMNYIDEYTLQLLLSQVMDSSQDELVSSLSQNLGYDLEANGVKVGFVIIFTPPTAMPTMSPTTVAFKNATRTKLRRRGWLLVTLFWIFVICCFSFENGLCACRRFRAKKEKYAGVELDNVGFH